MTPDQVSAVLVTRGNTNLKPVLDSLIFDDVIVWDNSLEPRDEMTFGRALGIQYAQNQVIWSQDDDIVHTPEDQERIVAAYEPGVLTGCMWPEWSDGARRQGIPDGYDDLVFCGSGAVYDRTLPFKAIDQYLDHFPLDDFFRLWCDTIVGIIAPTKQLDIRFGELPEADAEYRMSHLPDGPVMKKEAIRRARWVRDRALVAA